MKLIHVQRARSIWLFDLRDLNPRGKDIGDDLVDWIKESYNFAVAPDASVAGLAGNPVAQVVQPGQANSPHPGDGLVFRRGHFQAREELFVEISCLTIFNDGIVIETPSSTEDGDLFAADLLESATREFTLNYDADMIRRRIHISELIVRSEVDLDRINQALLAFASRISEASKDGDRPQFRVSGFSFWSEPTDSGFHKIFSVERQAGKPFKERRYYSQAPLQTSDHLRLLTELEQAIMEPESVSA